MAASDRTAALHEAKRADSRRKQKRVLSAVQRLTQDGSRVTFARVAREADVSTWLVYNTSELATAVRDAMQSQHDHGREPSVQPSSNVSIASVRTDLAIALNEIKSLRTERDALRKRVERVLGDEIRESDRAQLVERIAELENLLRGTRADLAAARRENSTLTELKTDMSAQLEAVRLLNQQLIWQGNQGDAKRDQERGATARTLL